MGFFGRKKAKKPAAPNENSALAPSVGVEQRAPAQTTMPIVRIVGDSKHITTNGFDANGRQVLQTTITQLTSEELHHYGRPASVSSTSSPKSSSLLSSEYSGPTAAPAPAPASMPATTPVVARQTQGADSALATEHKSIKDDSSATTDKTRELVKGFISDIWNRGKVELIQSICHASLRFNGHVGMDRVGHDGFSRMVTTVREALTDYHCEIHSMVVEGNKAFCRLKFTGKHTGMLLGYPPTGKPVAWMGASEFTCKNGKILKVWELGDVKSLEEQLRSAGV